MAVVDGTIERQQWERPERRERGYLGLLVAPPLLIWVMTSSAVPVCEQVTLRAEIGAGGREIRGEVSCTVGRAGTLAVATYPGVLGPERGLDDVNREWFYPHGYSAARMQIWDAGSVVHEAEGAWLELGSFGEGEVVRLTFETVVPRRNGTFGQSELATYLLGGWYPAFGDGERLVALSTRYAVSVPPGLVGVVNGSPLTRDGERTIEGEAQVRFVPVVLAREATVHAGEAAVVFAPAESGAPLRRFGSGRDEAALTELQATLTAGAAAAVRHGLVVVGGGAQGRRPWVVLAPLRENLVEPFDGGLAVSDRAFHLLGFERFLKLHRGSIWRQQLALLALPFCQQREQEGLPPALVADLLSTALVERLVVEVYGGVEYAPDMLETFAVIPEIDSLIFAPQVSFVDSYFAAIDERPAQRWRLDNFDHTLPRGKLLHEKLVDLFGEEAVVEIVDAYLSGETSWLAVAEARSGRSLGEWAAAWLGPYPRLNYALRVVETAGGEVVVRVEAQGPDAGHAQGPDAGGVREPVVVEVVDDDGAVHRQQRLGPGELRFPVGSVDWVELDPEHRLVELWHPPGQGPRFDNRFPARWRFLLTNIASVISATNGELELAANFSLRRIHDLRWRLDFLAAYSPTKLALATTGSWGFGPEITPLVLAHRLGLSVAYERLRREGPSILPGDQVSVLAYYRHDDRLNPYWSFEGKGWSVAAAWALGRDVDGRLYQFANVGAGALGILPLAFGHSLVGRLRGDLNLGDAPPQDLLSVGNLYRAGRGYLRADGQGNRRLVATGEYRHLWSGDANADLGGLVTWTRWEGALFADGVYLDLVEPAGCGGRHAFADVGYGLRFIGDVFGVSPAAITVDLGVPLVRCPGRDALPVTVYLGFVQSLAAF